MGTAMLQVEQQNTQVEPWYVDDPSLQTRAAAVAARAMAHEVMLRGTIEPKPAERNLFHALHVCAFRSRRAGRSERATMRRDEVWRPRWEALREYIAGENVGLVYCAISRFQTHETDRDDLLSDGMFGLVRAVDRYNPFRGFRFSTYAFNVIIRAMMRRRKAQKRYHDTFALHGDIFTGQTNPPDYAAQLYAERLKRAMHPDRGHLTELEYRVLAQRFAVNGKNTSTFHEIGENVGLSKERVRQIQNTALTKLREVLTNDPLLS